MTKRPLSLIYTTYGRFPAQLDAMHMCMAQAHHLETNYYNRFFAAELMRRCANHARLACLGGPNESYRGFG